MEANRPHSGVVEFYKDSVVLITGATGFIGKAVVEKLLRSFQVRKIYLLIRAKGGVDAKARMVEMFQDVVYDKIKSTSSKDDDYTKMVHPINVNFDSSEIMAPTDRALVLADVQIILNVMASVKFNEDIETALRTNVISSRRLFQLAEHMQHLKSIVHVSTFYSNCHRTHIDELVYDDLPFGGYENILDIFKRLSSEEKEQLKSYVLGNMPNSYTFSKRCAETMIKREFERLPIGIFRPPIVSSAYREPTAGWINNFNGPAGLVIPLIQGRAYWIYGKPEISTNLVPVDYCVNAMLTAAADVHAINQFNRYNQCTGPFTPVTVYNYTSGYENHISQEQIVRHIVGGLDTPWQRWTGKYMIRITASTIIHQLFIWWILLQASLIDVLRAFGGKKKKYHNMARRVLALEQSTAFFRCHSWTSSNCNIRRIWSELSAQDRQILPFNLEGLDWKDYYRQYAAGVKAAFERCLARRKRIPKSLDT